LKSHEAKPPPKNIEEPPSAAFWNILPIEATYYSIVTDVRIHTMIAVRRKVYGFSFDKK
jgi:hypothetical protein